MLEDETVMADVQERRRYLRQFDRGGWPSRPSGPTPRPWPARAVVTLAAWLAPNACGARQTDRPALDSGLPSHLWRAG